MRIALWSVALLVAFAPVSFDQSGPSRFRSRLRLVLDLPVRRIRARKQRSKCRR